MKVSTNLFFDRASTQLATVQSNLSKTQDINESLGELAGFDIPFSPNYLD